MMAAAGLICAIPVVYLSSSRERRPVPPARPILSQSWCAHTKVRRVFLFLLLGARFTIIFAYCCAGLFSYSPQEEGRVGHQPHLHDAPRPYTFAIPFLGWVDVYCRRTTLRTAVPQRLPTRVSKMRYMYGVDACQRD
jgi:hypothetical protein